MSVVRDQNDLVVSLVEQIAALPFRSSSDSAVHPLVPTLFVTDDMLITLADDIIESTNCFSRIPEES